MKFHDNTDLITILNYSWKILYQRAGWPNRNCCISTFLQKYRSVCCSYFSDSDTIL